MALQLAYSKYYAYSYTLECDPFATFKMILGKERIEQYELNRFPLELVYEFMNGRLGRKSEGVFNNLVGYEFNTHVVKTLQKLNAENIKSEVDIQTGLGNTSIDCIATFNVAQKFIRVLPTLMEEPFYINGENTFENKATRKLPKKTLMQVKKAKTLYSSTNVIVLADTKITPEICKKIYNEDTNIIRSVVSKNDLINNLLNIQKQIRILH